MGRNFFEYNFKDAIKPCGDLGECIKDAEKNCQWYAMCDLSEKTPWKEPTQPKERRNPKKQACVKVYLPGSKFFEKQREIKRNKR